MQKHILLLAILLTISAPAYALTGITGIKGATLDPTAANGGVSCVGSIDLTAEGNAVVLIHSNKYDATSAIPNVCLGGNIKTMEDILLITPFLDNFKDKLIPYHINILRSRNNTPGQ